MNSTTTTRDTAETIVYSGEIPRTKKVIVYNDSDSVYIETFKGDTVTIPAHGSIQMNRSDAVEFSGQFPGKDPRTSNIIIKNLLYAAVPESGSSLRAHNERHVCHVCSQVFTTSQALEEHTNEYHRKQQAQNQNKVYVCSKCDSEYIDKIKLAEHIKNAHPEKDQQSIKR